MKFLVKENEDGGGEGKEEQKPAKSFHTVSHADLGAYFSMNYLQQLCD